MSHQPLFFLGSSTRAGNVSFAKMNTMNEEFAATVITHLHAGALLHLLRDLQRSFISSIVSPSLQYLKEKNIRPTGHGGGLGHVCLMRMCVFCVFHCLLSRSTGIHECTQQPTEHYMKLDPFKEISRMHMCCLFHIPFSRSG